MYENYRKLRDLRAKKDADVARGTGITKSTFSDWKTGRSTPKNEKLQKIADFFNVSLDYLISGEDISEEKYYLNDETAKAAQEIFDNKDLRVLFDAARDATREDLRTAHDILIALKRKERGVDDTGC